MEFAPWPKKNQFCDGGHGCFASWCALSYNDTCLLRHPDCGPEGLFFHYSTTPRWYPKVCLPLIMLHQCNITNSKFFPKTWETALQSVNDVLHKHSHWWENSFRGLLLSLHGWHFDCNLNKKGTLTGSAKPATSIKNIRAAGSTREDAATSTLEISGTQNTEPNSSATSNSVFNQNFHSIDINGQWNTHWPDPLHILGWVFLPHQPKKTHHLRANRTVNHQMSSQVFTTEC